jgi:hypothetical protein
MRTKRHAPTSDWRVEFAGDMTDERGGACAISAKVLADGAKISRAMSVQSDRMVFSLIVPIVKI